MYVRLVNCIVPIIVVLLKTTTINASTIYKVKDYGIFPDGRPIAEKLAKLTRTVSNSGGGIILFDAGEYVFGAGLTKDSEPKGNVRLYSNVHYKGVKGTILKANNTGRGFHDLFCTVDHSVKNVVFENITFETYIGSRNRNKNDFRLAIILHWCKNVKVRNCRFIHDIGTIDTRYSHIQTEKNGGVYRVDGLTIENCIFEAKLLRESGYRDITSLGVCAQNVTIRNNIFVIFDRINKNEDKYYPNCCLELQGKDMWIYGNTFQDYTNAIDFTNTDSFSGKRNINIYNNVIHCFRGIGIWCRDNWYARGLNIYNNTFIPACDNSDKRITGVKGCVVFVSHATDSKEGNFLDIKITNNTFDYSKTKDYFQSLSYKKWISIPQHKFDEKNGVSFEEYYSVIALGGTSVVRKDITINNNVFVGCVFPSIYIGGRNVSRSHKIIGNIFRNCGIDGRWPLIELTNRCSDVIIKNNKLEVENNLKERRVFFRAMWAGLATKGFARERECRFDNIVIKNNGVIDEKGEKRENLYSSDYTLLRKGNGNIYAKE